MVFTVDLPAKGPVWEDLTRQFVDHCRNHQLHLTGYDDSHQPRGPSDAPFVLLWSSNKGPTTKLRRFNMELGNLGPVTFTSTALVGSRYSSPPYPWKGEHEGLPLIHVGQSHVLSPMLFGPS